MYFTIFRQPSGTVGQNLKNLWSSIEHMGQQLYKDWGTKSMSLKKTELNCKVVGTTLPMSSHSLGSTILAGADLGAGVDLVQCGAD